MRIAFVHDWQPSQEQAVTWKDGLAAAMRELATRHDVRMFSDVPHPIQHEYFTIYPVDGVAEYKPDVILHWADMTRPHAAEHVKLGVPMAICFAGGECMSYNTDFFDHIFVESEVYRKKFADAGYSVSIAFGTNTDLFTPEPRQQKMFDILFPATYARWKRHELLAQATKGLRVATAGYMYPNTRESDCYEVMQDNGALVLPHVSAEALRALYAASKCVVIPSRSDGGSQRTVLEAMAMNIPLVVTDSDKYYQYWPKDQFLPSVVAPTSDSVRYGIEEAIQQHPTTRDHILKYWSHIIYADAIEKELLRLCRK